MPVCDKAVPTIVIIEHDVDGGSRLLCRLAIMAWTVGRAWKRTLGNKLRLLYYSEPGYECSSVYGIKLLK